MAVNTVQKNERHVELAERYPILQSDDWNQADVRKLAKHLAHIPEEEQPELLEFMVRARRRLTRR